MLLPTQTQGTGEVATVITILVANSFLFNAPSFPYVGSHKLSSFVTALKILD